ncbi:serine hydrolase domain-containing protein [Modestobacter versicolor]|uniref:CubicO group peptidase (Beta-lactamase class C family) n=1 Tax=Modestobacter versicolor TaxID=429133 RepID=A0A323V338_9ACTN|nr:serine hydrolase domain-containing protein [Modestobacter versicolor]MBB3678458.1 CubicO group peptidase (beta-lactamase class C family) [Modestobacter versicolor]PZA19239.1 serine hydrolase [Modestobacter versicolor]
MSTTPERTAEVAADLAPYLESWLEHQRRRSRVPGVQAAVRVGDRVVLDTALGAADVSTGAPLTTGHLFRIASHSKTFTATAVLQLVEAGRLRLDDPIAALVPAMAGTGLADVTVRELLGHQGGVVRDGRDNDHWQLLQPFPDEQRLTGIAVDEGVVLERNEHFKYSNIGYSLLGLAIEAVTGTGYGAHVQAAVVDRLGLADTGPDWDPARAVEHAAGHTGLLDGEDTRLTVPHVDTRAMAAATGFFSTARDLTTFGAAHFTGDTTLLTEASKRLMRRPESEIRAHGGDPRYYGLGMDLRTVGERRLVGHSGGYPGHITRTWIDPEGRLVVSVLTNAVDGPADVLARGLVALLDLALAAPEDADRPPAAELQRYTGRFANLWGVTDVALLGGRLVLLHPAAAEPTEDHAELTVVDPDTLRLETVPGFGSPGETVDYEWADDGTVARVRIGGISAWPLEVFRAGRAAQVAR